MKELVTHDIRFSQSKRLKLTSHRSLAGTSQLWCKWMIVTLIGGLVGWVVGFVCFEVVNGVLPGEISWVLGTIVSGIVLGAVQWHFIRPPVKGFELWIAASAIGWVISFVLTVYMLDKAASSLDVVIGSMVAGTAFGLAQGFAMQIGFKGKTSWFGKTVVGWSAAMVLGIILSEGSSLQAIQKTAPLFMSFWASGAAILCVFLFLLLLFLFPEQEKKDSTKHVRWWT